MEVGHPAAVIKKCYPNCFICQHFLYYMTIQFISFGRISCPMRFPVPSNSFKGLRLLFTGSLFLYLCKRHMFYSFKPLQYEATYCTSGLCIHSSFVSKRLCQYSDTHLRLVNLVDAVYFVLYVTHTSH